jgi:triosephosphate isomerase
MAVINDVVTTKGRGARAVLYGGSVNATNASKLLSDPNTHGLFIGRAALEASDFLDLIQICAAQAISVPSPRHP